MLIEQSDDHSFGMRAFGHATASTNDSIKPCLFFQSVFVDTFTKHKKPVGVTKSKSFIFPFLSAYWTNMWTYFLKAHNAKVCITLHVRSREMSKSYKLYNLQRYDWPEMPALRPTSSFRDPLEVLTIVSMRMPCPLHISRQMDAFFVLCCHLIPPDLYCRIEDAISM